MIRAALRALLSEIVDYAGLFPPAALDMRAAVGNYARYRASEDAWALGRFITPAARLDELADALTTLPSHSAEGEWRSSATLSGDVRAEMERVRRFNGEHAGLARIDAVETRLDTASAIADAGRLARGVSLFIEIPVGDDPGVLVAAIRDAGAKAKMRTGGVVPDAFPSPTAIVRFLRCCHELGVPFKATAGLHHPLRGTYPLTYAADAECATMYGFLNVLLAAAVVDAGADDELAQGVLEATELRAVQVDAGGVSVAGIRFAAADLRRVRERALVSFGSCSFREPMDELRTAGLL